MIIFLVLLLIAILYVWWQVFKLQVMLSTLVLKEHSKTLLEDYIKQLDFKGGHNTKN